MKIKDHNTMSAFILSVFIVTFTLFVISEKAFCHYKNEEKSKTAVEQIKVSGTTTPTNVIKKYEGEVKEVVKKYKDKNGPDSVKKKDSEILEKVRMFFDIPRLAQLSLGEHWKKITLKDRREYMNLFRQLIERSYVSQADQLIGNYKVVYEDENVKGAEATVTSRVIKDDADVDIKYEMHKNSSGWMIYNVIADSTNLVKIYQTSYNKIIGKYGFKDLLNRMRNKLVENKG